MKKIGILYSTVDGHTKKISEFLAGHLKKEDTQISLFSISDFTKEVTEFDTLVIGASIRYGKHSDEFIKFINDNRDDLEKIITAFFSVNLVARNADKNNPETNPYVIKFIEAIDWKPDLVDVFAGCLDYRKYGFFDKLMIKAIMMYSRGPITTKEPIEYTDWERVRNFGEKILMLEKDVKPISKKTVLT